MVVAIFTHNLALQAQTATKDAVKYVQAQTQLPQQRATRSRPASSRTPSRRRRAAAGAPGSSDPLKNAPKAPPGSAMAQQQATLRAGITTIYQDTIAKAFSAPFYAAAIAALLAVFPRAAHRAGAWVSTSGTTR